MRTPIRVQIGRLALGAGRAVYDLLAAEYYTQAEQTTIRTIAAEVSTFEGVVDLDYRFDEVTGYINLYVALAADTFDNRDKFLEQFHHIRTRYIGQYGFEYHFSDARTQSRAS